MKTLWQHLKQHALTQPRRTALIDADQRLDYGDLLAQIQRRSRAISRSRGKVMALALPNSVEWVLWDLAALHAGICCVPLPAFFSKEQLSHVIADAAVDTMLDEHGLRAIAPVNPDCDPGLCKITYTSGSTGSPKGVCLTHEGIEQLNQALLEVLGTSFARHHLSVLPLSVLLENVAGLYPALMAASTIHLYDSAALMSDPAKLRGALADTRASTAILVPELLRALLACRQDEQHNLTALQFVAVGGARVTSALVSHAHEQGLPVYSGYGLSECGSVVSLNTPEHNRADSAGRVLPHLNANVIDGEIVVANPVARGYLGQVPFSGLYTGDCGEIDEDGYLYIGGRRDNLIVTSWGRNVNPEWVEAKLLDRPGVVQAIVCGEAERSLSALIVASPQASTDAIAQAIRKTNLELPHYARVHRWRRVDPFTRANGQLTGNGRPVRAHIQKIYSLTEQHHAHHIL